MAKVAVIGAGVGGMMSAARLAKYGHAVEIFESSHRAGGKCRTEWFGDFGFDLGPSLLTIPAVFRDFFIRTGTRFENNVGLKPVDPSFRYNFSDGTILDFPNLSLPKTCEAIEKTCGKSAADQWHNLMQRAELMWDVARTPFIESELKPLNEILRRPGAIRDLMKIAPLSSLRSYTRSLVDDERLRYIVDRYATYSGSDPRKAPAVLLTIAFIETTFGAWHLEGGVGTLADALLKRCIELGVQVHFNAPVSAIRTSHGSANGIQLQTGEVISADVVVANADAHIVYENLISSDVKVKSERRKLRRSTPSFSGFSLQIGIDRNKGWGPELAHHNIFFPENYDEEFDYLFQRRLPVPDPTIYICSPQGMTKRANTEAWSVLINAPLHATHDRKRGFDWSGYGEKYAEHIIDRMEAKGLNVRSRMEFLRIQTPQDLENQVNAPGGSIYGTSSNGARATFLRAKNRSPIHNLYCVGGSAHPGGGLPLVGMSAEIVAEAVQRDLTGDTNEGVRSHHGQH